MKPFGPTCQDSVRMAVDVSSTKPPEARAHSTAQKGKGLTAPSPPLWTERRLPLLSLSLVALPSHLLLSTHLPCAQANDGLPLLLCALNARQKHKPPTPTYHPSHFSRQSDLPETRPDVAIPCSGRPTCDVPPRLPSQTHLKLQNSNLSFPSLRKGPIDPIPGFMASADDPIFSQLF